MFIAFPVWVLCWLHFQCGYYVDCIFSVGIMLIAFPMWALCLLHFQCGHYVYCISSVGIMFIAFPVWGFLFIAFPVWVFCLSCFRCRFFWRKSWEEVQKLNCISNAEFSVYHVSSVGFSDRRAEKSCRNLLFIGFPTWGFVFIMFPVWVFPTEEPRRAAETDWDLLPPRGVRVPPTAQPLQRSPSLPLPGWWWRRDGLTPNQQLFPRPSAADAAVAQQQQHLQRQLQPRSPPQR